ncbi:flagellar biosynthetic protein FliR [Corallincola spongiicola]|uniref:Flagellar biosynthetic protein FliR n=1 Tax=Corallincola spongiicola TaxID=2520508 RepID=A0ABY1WKJ2_9GAMM|nr:flagellar biosynthetic protein FliR [Corallincola spongiicola]TAA40305.1 flagellar type III secretion system protein FliR [Corallincola spongiicola]
MEFPMSIIMETMASYLWPLVRISSMLMVMVAIGTKNVSTRIRLGLSVAVTLAAVPALPAPPPIDPFSIQGALVTMHQVLIGTLTGFISVLTLHTFVVAGQVVGMQTSLGFASLVDPSNGQSVPVIGQFYLMLATLLFFAIDGHLLMIRIIIESFHTLPVGANGIEAPQFDAVARWMSWVFAGGLALALSALVALLLINFSFGVMTRAAPQLNIFTIGFPVTMLSGLLIIWLTLGNFVGHFEAQWYRGVALMCQVLNDPC